MSILSTAAPWDMVAQGYSETTMQLFQGYCETALDLVDVQSDDHIADIACGPGTLTFAAAERVASVKALDFSPNMLAMLRQGIAERGLANVDPHHGDGQNLPFDDGSFDAAFSLFGLMFFPNRTKGYAELYRTLKRGGRVCVSSWAPVSSSPLMQTMFGAMQAINPNIPDPKADLESLENPDLLKAEIAEAGFADVVVHRVTRSAEIVSAETFWNTMTKGSAPVVLLKNTMPDEAWREKSKHAIEKIENTAGPFPTALSATAWLGVGAK